MANVKFFRSTHTNAPTLNGTTQSLNGLLQACLVDGYNTVTVTITRDGAVATATATAHGFETGRCLLIAGAGQAEYNGEFYITVTGADTFTFAVDGSPATPATGTITAKYAPGGWTKPYTGSNLAAYRAAGGNRMYLRVDDSQNQYASVAGYASMTDISSGSDRFPSGSVYWWKSNAANTTARPWLLVANDRTLYLYVAGNSTASSGTYCDVYSCGDLRPTMTGDQYSMFVQGDIYNSTAFNTCVGAKGAMPSYTSDGLYLCRDYTYVAGAKTAARWHDTGRGNALASSGTYQIGSSGLVYPNPTDGGLHLSRTFCGRALALRGEFPGLWAPCHDKPLAPYDTFEGSGDLAGRTFLAVSLGYSTTYGQLFLEISNTWDI